ncbi:MAG: 6-phosphofructokinase [Rikenellaceae bacterium]
MKETVAIVTAGGPAPGINTVISSIVKTFLQKGYRVIGLHVGYKGLFSKERKITEFTYEIAESIFNRGGSFLAMSRFKPKDSDFEEKFCIDFFTENNIKLLVTIGGDDTASTANRVTKYLEKKKYPIANIHVPKTIDNDLPLPEGCPTFGYQSAKDKGAQIASIIMDDAKASGNWFVICAMGRSAGHLAFGVGIASHLPMIIIPEMFNKTTITVDKIVNLISSTIIKRKMMGMEYGVAIISEGVFHALSTDEIAKAGITFSYDEHGHPELGKVSKAQIFCQMITNKINQVGIKAKMRPEELGYEVRCAAPNSYDLVYCTMLAMGVYKLYKEGKTGCIVYTEPDGTIKSLSYKDAQDPASGKILPRLVNANGDKLNLVANTMLTYIGEDDYEAAKAYVDNPEEYDFKKILKWE